MSKSYAMPFTAHFEEHKYLILNITKLLVYMDYDVTPDSWAVDHPFEKTTKLSALCLVTGADIEMSVQGQKLISLKINGEEINHTYELKKMRMNR